MSEPDQSGFKRAHTPLALGVWFVELAEPHRHIAGDCRAPAGPDDDHLRAAGGAGRRDKPDPGQQLELALDGHVPQIGCVDPLSDRVVLLGAFSSSRRWT